MGNLVYLSGHGPDKPEGGQVTGKVGSDLTIEQALGSCKTGWHFIIIHS
ncbi:MAG: hypothetical protein WKG06_31915 [Segetibacter sp.]